MKMITNRYLVYITTTLLITMFYNCSLSIEKNQEYFGQKPPGMEPELFATVLVFKGLHRQVLFAEINGNKKYKDCRPTEIKQQQYLDKLLKYMVNKKHI